MCDLFPFYPGKMISKITEVYTEPSVLFTIKALTFIQAESLGQPTLLIAMLFHLQR